MDRPQLRYKSLRVRVHSDSIARRHTDSPQPLETVREMQRNGGAKFGRAAVTLAFL